MRRDSAGGDELSSVASRKSKKKRARSRARRLRAGRVILCGVVVLVGFLYYGR